MSLSFRATLAQRHFNVQIEMASGERIAVLGHNGSGKSTLMNILAGTLRPDHGRAVLDEKTLFDLGGLRRSWLPPHQRGVCLLSQDALLFPHLDVRDNVAFGPRVSGASKKLANKRAEHWLDVVGASEFADRRPSQLSGGQAQRVAIARALAAEPTLLLLDEPMAALDVAVAPLLRRVLRRVLADQSSIIVTHDLLDALVLSERIVVLEEGRVAESGPTDEVLRHPKTRFTARVAGLNLMRGSYRNSCVEQSSDLILEGNHREGFAMSAGEPAAAVFSPSAVTITVGPSQSSARNKLPTTIVELQPSGEMVRVRADDHHGHVLSADVTMRSVADLDLYPGREVTYSVKAGSVSIYPV
ncbi:MAG: ATP-binding cassette domain-containing protein [Propionibacterium sp.]